MSTTDPAPLPGDLEQRRSSVLVVDDNPTILAVCQEQLGPTYDITTAGSAEHALEHLERREFTVLIADQCLPGMDGVELLSRAHARQPNTARILITGYGSHENSVAAINTGKVHRFVAKPWHQDDFVELVAQEARVASLRFQLEAEHRRYHGLVFDERSGLPTRHMLQHQAAAWLQEHGFLGVLLVDASELWAAQGELGRDLFHQLEMQFVASLKAMAGRQFRREDLLAIDEVESACFCVFLSHPREERISCASDVLTIGRRLQEQLMNEVSGYRLPDGAPLWPSIAVGHGFVLHNPHLSSSYQVREIVRDARDDARRKLASEDRAHRKSQLERIIVGRQISSVFQPIVNLKSNAVLGYEALSRGPTNTEYESPLFLLKVADRTGLTVELDRVFRSIALTNAAQLPEGKIFVNTLPSTVYDPDMSASRLAKALELLNIDPSRVVLEFSERYVVSNEAMLMNALEQHRAIGIELAIDDVGAGYSGLERIASLEPEYLKIDISLVRHIDQKSVKRSVLSALGKMADEIGAQVIAEGIEEEPEKQCLMDIGVTFGQGYLIARPARLS